jgi:excisionase family DNA binding protein
MTHPRPRPATPPPPSSAPAASAANEPPDDLVSPREIARQLKCSLASVYRWLFQRKLTGYRRAGTRYLISRREAAKLLETFRPPALPPRRPSA